MPAQVLDIDDDEIDEQCEDDEKKEGGERHRELHARRDVIRFMVDILIYFAVLVIVLVLLWWLLQQLPLPEPAGKFIQIAIVVIVAVVVIAFLLQFTGGAHLPHLVR